MAKTAEFASDLLTVDDLWAIPDDGRRRELIDGMLIVNPSPRIRHQRVVGQLHLLLAPVCPDELEVFMAPVDWVISEHTLLQPDLLVVRTSEYPPDEANIVRPPLLVVEVRSPSSARYDAGTKRLAYEAAGAAWYWMVDPAEPRLTVLQLADGRYVEAASVAGDEAYDATEPISVRVVPSQLVRR